MAQTGFRWERPPEQALNELTQAYIAKIHRGIYAIAQGYAPEIEKWMKKPENAIWKDHSGHARGTLYTEARQVVGSIVELVLSHGMEYGIFLELNNAGKYAVIGPALDHWAPILWKEVVRMLS